MDQALETVRRYYDENAAAEWDRLEVSPFEFTLTTWMMDKYIRPGDSILDVGGGPGRYALHWAQKGCAVTLVDLSSGNTALARQKAEQAGVELRIHTRNCLELDALDLGEFDHVFLMGPLYHLQKEADRAAAVEACLRRLKPGGNLYVSFILLIAALIYDLQNPGQLLEDVKNPIFAQVTDALASGGDFLGEGFTEVYFYHQDNILPFMGQFGLKQLHLFGQEGFLAPNKGDLLRRDPAELQLWLELAKRYLELPELLSWSEHAMYIGQKPQ